MTVEVTQADRDAAWPFVPQNSIAGTDRAGFFAGKYDEAKATQAFAAHRIAALEGVAGLVEALERLTAYRHYHLAVPDAPEKCGRCDKNWRDEVHYRAHESHEDDVNAGLAALATQGGR